MNICIIPARGGSKRIPHKNTKLFCGEPIVCTAMEIVNGLFDEVVVSTDDLQVMEYAESLEVRHVLRDAYTARDEAELEEVVIEVLDWYNDEFDTCCMLLPTGVFSQYEDIFEAVRSVEMGEADLVYTVTEYDHPAQRALKIRGGMIEPWVDFPMINTQDFEKLYHDAGQFYVFDTAAFREGWLHGRRLLQMEAKPVILPKNECHDIDTLEDWKIAEMKWEAMQ